jgi:threonine dehydratase
VNGIMGTKAKSLAEKIRKEALAAEKRIHGHIRETPAEPSLYLSREGKCNVYLKCENLQLTGSFKLRGAVNKITSLSEEEKRRGLMTASSGNHGAAFSWALKRFGLVGTIVLPEITPQTKIDALLLYGSEIIKHGDDCIEAERYGRKTAEERGLTYIPPYNDPHIIGGQGTIGIELIRQVPEIECVLVPVGGGGLIAGIAGYLKSQNADIEIIGCQPENSAVMYHSLKAGKVLDLESKPTISDGSAGGIEQDTITFPICQELVDDFILVSETEIKSALKLILTKHYMMVEGAAVLSVAAFLQQKNRFKEKNVILILSGSKISLATLKEIA